MKSLGKTETGKQLSRRSSALTALLPTLLVAPASLHAATPASQTSTAPPVETVTVTARHRREKAQSVPISLSTVSAAKLAATNITQLNQLSLLVPTLQVVEFNPRNTSFNIRGIGNNVSVANDGLESGVGVYVDNVFYSRPAQATFSFPDLQDVQVLRGPQGTLFGKNTTAGALDVHTQAPSFMPAASLESSVGNYGYWQVKGVDNQPISSEVAASLAFVLDGRNGTETSLTSGQHYGNYRDQAGRLQILYAPNEDLTVRIIGDYEHQLANCCVYFPTGTFTTLTNGTPIANDFQQREQRLGFSVATFNAFGRDAAINRPTFYAMESGGVSVQADYLFGGFDLASISAWRLWNWYPHNGAITSLQPDVIGASNQTDYQRQASQEFRFTSPLGGKIDYTSGLFFFYQDMPGVARTQYGDEAGNYLVGNKISPIYANPALDGYDVAGHTDPVTNLYAAYVQATWHIVRHLDLTGGLRYTYEDKSGSYDQQSTGGADLSAFPKAIAASLKKTLNSLGSPVYYNDHTHNSLESHLVTLNYTPSDTILTYATYARGEKSAGINVTSLPASVDPIVKPERVDNYEVGVKTSWLHDRLTVNADAFWLEDNDYQGIAAAPLGSGVYVSYINSVPEVRSRGIEFDTRARPASWLSLNWSGAYTDAIYESYQHAVCPPEVQGSATKICDLSGAALPGTSRWVTSVGGEITQPLAHVGRYDVIGYVGADFSLRSSFNVSASDSKYAQIPGYGLLDLRIGARTSDGKYDAFLWSHNATNTKYYMVLGAATPFSGLTYGIPGDPLTFGLTARVRL